jgi:NPCBM/NEW2 domain/Pregnancy-associated plasma protein-A/Secretion system C-terminal sorting domain
LLFLFVNYKLKAQGIECGVYTPQTDEIFEQELNSSYILPFKQFTPSVLPDGYTPPIVNYQTYTYIIPVVVHIIHNSNDPLGIGTNISLTQIQNQIDILNFDYNNKSSRPIPLTFDRFTSSPNFRFVLAKIDPNGNPTNGVTRTSVANNTYDLENNHVLHPNTDPKKNIRPAWNTSQYLNIWVANLTNNGLPGLLGYANFPSHPNPEYHGVVINYAYFGTGPERYTRSTTLPHEVAHYFNLKHISGDDAGCSGTDEISDTPNQGPQTAAANLPIELFNNLIADLPVRTDLCSTVAPGTMYMNYMDYSGDCRSMFTALQVGRMRYTGRYPSYNRNQFCYPTIATVTSIATPPSHTTNGYSNQTKCEIKIEQLTGIGSRWELVLANNESKIFKTGFGNSVVVNLASPNTLVGGLVKMIFYMKRAGINEEVRIETSNFSPNGYGIQGITPFGWFGQITPLSVTNLIVPAACDVDNGQRKYVHWDVAGGSGSYAYEAVGVYSSNGTGIWQWPNTTWNYIVKDLIETSKTATFSVTTNGCNVAGSTTQTSSDGAITPPPTTGGVSSTYLSDNTWAAATTGYGNVNKDKSTDNNALRIGGVTYAKGLGVHAFSEVTYNLNTISGGGFTSFEAVIGRDDEGDGCGNDVTFEVFVDNVSKGIWVKTKDQSGQQIAIDITGKSTLRLVVNLGNDGSYSCDHADWADAKLTKNTTNTSTPTSNTPPTSASCNITLSLVGTATDLNAGSATTKTVGWIINGNLYGNDYQNSNDNVTWYDGTSIWINTNEERTIYVRFKNDPSKKGQFYIKANNAGVPATFTPCSGSSVISTTPPATAPPGLVVSNIQISGCTANNNTQKTASWSVTGGSGSYDYVCFGYNGEGTSIWMDPVNVQYTVLVRDNADLSKTATFTVTPNGCNQASSRIGMAEIENIVAKPAHLEIGSEFFTIFPNPAKESITITSNSGGIKKTIIYDELGKIQNFSIINNTVFGTIELNINALKAGLYFTDVETETKRYIKKFIKIN